MPERNTGGVRCFVENRKSANSGILTTMDFFSRDEVILAFSNKRDGNMSLRWGTSVEEVVENRRTFLGKHHLRLEDCVMPSLVHADEIVVVRNEDAGKGMIDPDTCIEAEALITNSQDIGLFILTADCFPVAYYDTVQKVIALAHLGWKPAGKHLAGKVVERMQDAFGCDPRDIQVCVGPGIHPESYRYDRPHQKGLPEWIPYLKSVPETHEFSIDLLGFVTNQLRDAGIAEENLEVVGIDTAVNQNFYSHYRSKATGEAEGRFATVVALK